MPRSRRVVAPGLPHHVTQRGNRRTDIFLDAPDREVYIRILRSSANRHELKIWAYALMSNHVHLVVVPTTEIALPSLIRDTHSAYANYFNQKYGTVGHLWHARFYSCVLEPVHLMNAVRYVERNPVRASIVKVAEDYPWSSAAHHCGLRQDPLLADRFPPEMSPANWLNWLKDGLTATQVSDMRKQTRSGRPSSESFLIQLEDMLGRRLRPRRRGRRPYEKGK